MSVNYYARTTQTPANNDGLHIGQHAHPCEFLWRAHPELGLTTVQAWSDYLAQPEIHIVAEHGLELDYHEFWPDAVARPANVDFRMATRWIPMIGPSERRWHDVNGHPFANYEFW
ncbi:hypothetical protein [Nocardia suismassiliense]|uniref:hypothetical protein n=1 Tax=Nocardia suismassiliense TaxID=2077092 RepID=UPI000D1E178E|nr:hypothetical protein [Nocardia suismassiliense]